MQHLRIAAVQLEFEPVNRTSDGGWRLGEPVGSADPLHEGVLQRYSLSSLRGQCRELREVCDPLRDESLRTYESNLSAKLRDIMTFLFRNEVDLVVFPEYSIPVGTLSVLRSFSSRICVVAGLGYMQRSDIEALRQQGLDVEGISQGNDAVAVLSPGRNFVLAKKCRAEFEQIQPGGGTRCVPLDFPKGTFTVGVAVCLDFLMDEGTLLTGNPDVVAIPSLSKNTEEFTCRSPRNFVRIYANHAYYGGTYIGAPNIKGIGFADANGTSPLQAGVEGIVVVDWDYKHPFKEKPTRPPGPDHRLYARAAIVYKGRDEDVALGTSHLDLPLGEEVRVYELLKAGRELRALVDRSGRYSPISQAMDALDQRGSTLLEEEVRGLIRHCVLNSDVLAGSEWRYSRAVAAADELRTLQDNVPEMVAEPLGQYEKCAREEAKNTRSKLVAARHKGPMVVTSATGVDESQLVLFARLGPYDEDAGNSFGRQLTMLRSLAQLHDLKVKLIYRLQTVRDQNGKLEAVWDVVCTANGCSQSELESLRESLGHLVHITFTGVYSMGYTSTAADQKDAIANVLTRERWWCEIRRSVGDRGDVLPFRGFTDWGLVVDFLRALPEPVTLELQCTPLPPDVVVGVAGGRSSESLRDINIAGDGLALLSGNGKASGRGHVGRTFEELLLQAGTDVRRLELRVFLAAPRPVPRSVIDCVGIELSDGGKYEVVDKANAEADASASIAGHYTFTPIEALRVFHPPFGEIYATSQRGEHRLNLFVDETQFPPTGIVLGRARTRHVKADEEIDVRLSERDRLRHLYIVGRTGSGKTNLLKRLASQDVKIPGRGVTVIDPHGDLVDHVLREVQEERLEEVVLIDLARTDALPVLNPLDLDRSDVVRRDRTIQELIMLLRTHVYHEHTGARFEELVRLTFESMLDVGYPVVASLVEVPRVLLDPNAQVALSEVVHNPELKQRWDFQAVMRHDPEYGSLIHYVTSRFDDISRDRTLRCVLGGEKATINIEDIVTRNGILLVRIPQAVIGKESADFIGSLILLQLRMAVIRRREYGETQRYHFVYVDEFQNFANTDFHTLVAEARKFNMGFTLANQNLEQLREFRTYTGVHEARLLGAILGNVAHWAAFSVGTPDAQVLGSQFGIRAEDVMRIGRYEALAKVTVNGYESRPFTLRGDEEVRRESPRTLEIIERRMKELYWRAPDEVLAEIGTRMERLKEYSQTGKASREDKDEFVARLGKQLRERSQKTKARDMEKSREQVVAQRPEGQDVRDDVGVRGRRKGKPD